MKHVNLRKSRTTRARLFAGLALTLSAATANADEDPKFTMTVFEDVAQGSEIIAGRYGKAIDAMAAKTSKNDVIRTETNLCVAYIKAGDVERAERSCDAAVAAIKARKYFNEYALSFESGHKARKRYLAIALSNRSVVNAVKGDYTAAQKDLDAALELDTRLAAVKINLERLDIAARNAA